MYAQRLAGLKTQAFCEPAKLFLTGNLPAVPREMAENNVTDINREDADVLDLEILVYELVVWSDVGGDLVFAYRIGTGFRDFYHVFALPRIPVQSASFGCCCKAAGCRTLSTIAPFCARMKTGAKI